MKNIVRLISTLVAIAVMITIMSVFSSAIPVDEITGIDSCELDYDFLLSKAYIINGNWTASDLVNNKDVKFAFRNTLITEKYVNTRHFSNFNDAYNYYLGTDPDILTDIPVFIFAPGTYDYEIIVRYSAIILGANAGINPNDTSSEWTANAMSDGWEANTERREQLESVFTGGITRTTRQSGELKWVDYLETIEASRNEKAHIQFLIDGVKITGSKGITQYDYSNRLYTNLKLNGTLTNYTPIGGRCTTTSLLNSVVDSYSGTGSTSLFSARCNSDNENDIVMKNVRLSNITSATSLFNKFFKNLTIDGMYYSNSSTHIFGYESSGATFCGSNESARDDQKITVTNSVFYKNTSINPISIGTSTSSTECKKQEALFDNNIFYDAVYMDNTADYWGIFLVLSKNTNTEYILNVTNNIIHQSHSPLKTLFNGNDVLQMSKTTINFNYNKVTGLIDCIYPNTSDQSASFVSNKLSYDFNYNFYAPSANDTGTLPAWDNPPVAELANGFDAENAEYYLDYNLTTLAESIKITEVSEIPGPVTISGTSIIADCTGYAGTITPKFITKPSDATVTIYSDFERNNVVTSINLDEILSTKKLYLTLSNSSSTKKYTMMIIMNSDVEISDISQLDPSKLNFPVIEINTTNNAPIVNKTDYVECNVSLNNTDDEYIISSQLAGIRYRGNSTYSNSDKKAYRIKFDKKQDVLGMGKAKNWVLLANAFDKTMVRNAIAFAIGQQLGLEYTSEFKFVNLYLNGEYHGVYLLCEQTQTGKTRVDVEEDETGKLDTGYLVEIAGNGKDDGDPYFTINEINSELFGVGVTRNWRVNTIYGIVKSPEVVINNGVETEGCSDEQLSFISSHVNNVNKAILTQDFATFNQIADVDSFAKYFIVNTVLNNGDSGYQIYLYKKENGGKVYAGPIWDFDQSSAASTHCGDTYSVWYKGSQNPWFDSMSNWNAFMKIAKSYYLENIDEIQSIINYYTCEFYYENAYDLNANEVVWNTVANSYWRCTSTIKKLVTYEDNYEHLNNWFSSRISWLTEQYNNIYTAPTNITISEDSLNLITGESTTLTYTLTPFYADKTGIIWSSSDENIAHVDSNGVVTGISDGNVIIKVTDTQTQLSAECRIRVYTIKHVTGSISIGDTYYAGDVITPTYNINANSYEGKFVWYRDNGVLGAQNGETYTVTKYDTGHTIKVEFIGIGDAEGTVTSNVANVLKKTPATPDIPVVAAQTETRITLKLVTGCEYRINDEEWQTSNIFSNLTPGATYKFTQRVAETNYENASEISNALEITLPKLTPNTPLAPTIENTDSTTITLTPINGYEYRVNGGEWQTSNVFADLVLGNTYNFDQRIAETDTTYASEISEVLSVKLIATLDVEPISPVIESKTPTSVTLVSVEGYEYRMNGGEWQSENVFSNLIPDNEYFFEQRIKQTSTHFASNISASINVILEKSAVPTPLAPSIETVTDTTITLTAHNGYEYRMNGGEWQISNVFDNLEKNTKYSFTQRISETDTSKSSDESEPVSARTVSGLSVKNFTDIKAGAWYEEYVDIAVKYGIFNGISDTTFEPNSSITRAMFVQALAKLAGASLDNSLSTKFIDVPKGKWYTGAVKWATDCGVVTGVSENEFAPTSNITREQMCVMLVRYANHIDIKLNTNINKATFSDHNKISNYAKDAVYACQMAGIINGMPNGTFEPKGTATRAQVAKIFASFFMEYIY